MNMISLNTSTLPQSQLKHNDISTQQKFTEILQGCMNAKLPVFKDDITVYKFQDI